MSAKPWTRLTLSLALGLSAIIASPATAGSMSIRTIGAHETHLAGLAHRIAIANPHACRSPAMMSGLVVHELGQYPLNARPAVSRAFSLSGGVGVLGIVPGSSAARAGLAIDDEIVAIRGRSIEATTVWTDTATSYARVDAFHAQLSAALQVGPADLVVRRAGRNLSVTISGQRGCGGIVKFVDSGNVNAWSDGRHVVINRGIFGMARGDDELAFIIGHEMAHNIFGHSTGSGREARALFGRLVGSASPRNAESQADIAAVSLVRAGGFDPHGGLRFLATAQRRMWWSFSLDRPSFGGRMRNVAAAIDRDRLRMAAYQPAPATTTNIKIGS